MSIHDRRKRRRHFAHTSYYSPGTFDEDSSAYKATLKIIGTRGSIFYSHFLTEAEFDVTASRTQSLGSVKKIPGAIVGPATSSKVQAKVFLLVLPKNSLVQCIDVSAGVWDRSSSRGRVRGRVLGILPQLLHGRRSLCKSFSDVVSGWNPYFTHQEVQSAIARCLYDVDETFSPLPRIRRGFF